MFNFIKTHTTKSSNEKSGCRYNVKSMSIFKGIKFLSFFNDSNYNSLQICLLKLVKNNCSKKQQIVKLKTPPSQHILYISVCICLEKLVLTYTISDNPSVTCPN